MDNLYKQPSEELITTGRIVACPVGLFELVEDEYGPLSDALKASAKPEHRKGTKYDCGPCKPVTDRPPLPCVVACEPGRSHIRGSRFCGM